MALTKSQIEILVEKIHSERERILNIFSNEDQNMAIKEVDGCDEVDDANSDYQRAQMLRFRSRDLFYAKKLDKALEKIEEGEFGICEDCGDAIRFERLLARPTAELCIVCKDEAEREESNSMMGRESKSLGKKIDLVSSI